MARWMVITALAAVALGIGGSAQAQQPGRSFVQPNGAQVWSPYTYTPYGAVYDPAGFLGHQYFNPYGVGNGGVPQYIDTNPHVFVPTYPIYPTYIYPSYPW